MRMICAGAFRHICFVQDCIIDVQVPCCIFKMHLFCESDQAAKLSKMQEQ